MSKILQSAIRSYEIMSDQDIKEKYGPGDANRLIIIRQCWVRYFWHLFMYRFFFKFIWKEHKKAFFLIFFVLYIPAILYAVVSGMMGYAEVIWPEWYLTIASWYGYILVGAGVWLAIDHIFQGFKRRRVVKECEKRGVFIMDGTAALNSYCTMLNIEY